MPKMKTKSGAKKRFKFLGNGLIKRTHSHLRHILTKKTKLGQKCDKIIIKGLIGNKISQNQIKNFQTKNNSYSYSLRNLTQNELKWSKSTKYECP